MSQLFLVDCTECDTQCVLHAPHRARWECYNCGADLRPDWQKEQED